MTRVISYGFESHRRALFSSPLQNKTGHHDQRFSFLVTFAKCNFARAWSKSVGANLEDGGNHEVIFLKLKDIQMELLTFLKEDLAGVTNIIEHCRAIAP